MNLRKGNGLVPIRNYNEASNAPYLLVEFPNPVVFQNLWGAYTPKDAVERYHAILQSRLKGATLKEAGDLFGISRERVRQIEARFLRLMASKHAPQSELSSTTEQI